MYFVPSWPAAVRNKMHVSIAVSWEKGQGIQTFRKVFSVSLTVFSCVEKMSPALYATERPLGRSMEQGWQRGMVLLLLKSPSTACKTEEAADPVTVTFPVTLLQFCPIPAPSLSLWTQERSALTRGRCWDLAPTPDTPSKGMFTGVKVNVGLCFLGPSEP